MHHFHYREGELCCEDVGIRAIAEEVGTPFYLYSRATLTRHFRAFDEAFAGTPHLLCYSAKANSGMAVIKTLADLGCGLDIVSGGELYRGLAAGVTPQKIVYSGVGKTAGEIDFALTKGILQFNVESFDELAVIDARARELGKTAPVALRVNPDVDPKTHPYISTGLKKNKFGIAKEYALDFYRKAASLGNIKPTGVTFHIGSQITQTGPFVEAVQSMAPIVAALRESGLSIQYLDVGGGLGISYDNEAPPLPGEYAAAIRQAMAGIDLTVIAEPGRAIVGNAGILVTRVLYEKEGPAKKFLVVDAGMNDLLRPSIYGAYHAVWPVRKTEGEITADVVGPICESGDFLAKDRKMAAARPGDLLAVMSAGAYGMSMSSNYNSRPRAAEIMVSENRFVVVRQRETYEDLVRGESAFS
ncbi:MAG: diaminopimelate decarboxylase [Thermodesulfobacteriota bacterium]